MYYCTYHNIYHKATDILTDEHIIPTSLGGSDELVIPACKHANDQMGSIVDAALIDNPMMAIERLSLNLKGHSGQEPSVRFKGTLNLGGNVRKGFLTIGNNVESARIFPEIHRSEEGTQTNYVIRCSPEEEARILQDINRKQAQRGESQFRIISRQKDFYVEPVLDAQLKIDVWAMQRAFCKMALGFGYYLLRERCSKHPDIAPLRKFIWERNRGRSILVRGKSWPDLNYNEVVIRMFGVKKYHVLSIKNNGSLIFTGILFGSYAFSIVLCEDAAPFVEQIPREEGIVVWIDPADRIMHRESLIEYTMKAQQRREG